MLRQLILRWRRILLECPIYIHTYVNNNILASGGRGDSFDSKLPSIQYPICQKKKKKKKKKSPFTTTTTTTTTNKYRNGTDLESIIRYAADMIAKCVLVGDWIGRDTNVGEEIYEIHD